MDGMTNAQFDALLETIARRVAAEAITIADAVRIIRESKTK